MLALTGYDLPDPLTIFYAERSPDVSDCHNRGYIVLANPMALDTEREQAADDAATAAARRPWRPCPRRRAEAAASDGDADGARRRSARRGGQAATPIAVRTDFNPLAVCSPAVPTDAQGRASIRSSCPTT